MWRLGAGTATGATRRHGPFPAAQPPQADPLPKERRAVLAQISLIPWVKGVPKGTVFKKGVKKSFPQTLQLKEILIFTHTKRFSAFSRKDPESGAFCVN